MLPPQARLESVTLDGERVTIRGTAESAVWALRYAEALGRSGQFVTVRISELRDAEAGSGAPAGGASFAIVVSR